MGSTDGSRVGRCWANHGAGSNFRSACGARHTTAHRSEKRELAGGYGGYGNVCPGKAKQGYGHLRITLCLAGIEKCL